MLRNKKEKRDSLAINIIRAENGFIVADQNINRCTEEKYVFLNSDDVAHFVLGICTDMEEN